MTCIIAMKSKDGSVWLAGDKMGSDGKVQRTYATVKVFQTGDFGFGFTTSFYMGQLLRHNWEQPVRPAYQSQDGYIFKTVIRSLKELFKENEFGVDCNTDVKTSFGEFIMVYEGRVFLVQDNMSLLEVDDFVTCGSGSDVANGAMEALMMTDMSEEDILNNAIGIASKHCIGVSSECDILQLNKGE